VVGLSSDFSSLDPLLLTDSFQYDPGGPVVGQLYDPLVLPNKKTGEVMPWLATWATSPDGRIYEFDIAKDANWSDGRPVVAQDFITTLKAAMRSKTAAGRGPLARIEGAEDYRLGKATSISGAVASGKHLTVRLGTLICTFLAVLPFTPPLPSHVFEKYLSDTDPTMNADRAPEHLAPQVTSGPFLFKEWRRGDEIVLRANAAYWRGRPLLDELVFRTVELSGLQEAMKNGSIDVAHRIDALGMGPFLGKDPRWQVVRFPYPGYVSIGWNTRSAAVPALADKRIRQALAYGLDAKLVVDAILHGEGGVTREHMHVASWAFTPGLNEYAYDPAKAEDLIRSAGYSKGEDGVYSKGGRRLAFTLVAPDDDATRGGIVQLAADQYRAIGVAATAKLEPRRVLFPRLDARDPSLDAFVLQFFWGTEPNPATFWHSQPFGGGPAPSSPTGYSSPDLDRTIDAGRFGPDCSIEARKRAYDSFNRMLNEDQPSDFLVWKTQFVITNVRVRGLDPGAFIPLPDAHLWWLAAK
jgi:peptide/nickel transport system substrate-binding protein